MKKLVALMLALCMLPVAALCELTPNGTFPITDTPEELTIFTTITAVQEPYENDYQSTFYEEKTGVHINWQAYDNNELLTNFNLSIGSNEYPDIYNVLNVDNAVWLEMIEEGIIIPLDDLIENTQYIKPYLDAHPDVKAACTSPDGHIYLLPQAWTLIPETTNPFKIWVYQEWMDAYCAATGNGVPATTEEFRDMLAYFRDNDMNGNGDPNDEIPLTGTYSRWDSGSDPMFYLMNSFCYCPVTFIDADENGKIYTNVATDEYREGLKYINSLYNEKLLDEGCYVQELNQFRALTSVAKDAVTVGVGTAGYPMRLLTQGSGVTWADYTCLAPLAGPKGVQISAATYDNYVYLNTAITKSCKNPELAIRWLDYWYSEEGQAWYLYNGVEGTDWEWVNEPSFGGGDKSISKITDRANETWLSYARPVLTTLESWGDMAAAAVADTTQLVGIQRNEVYAPYAQYTNLPQIVWCDDSDLIDEYNELKTLIVNNYILTSSTKFITGELDVNDDAVWADYVKGLEDRGLSRFLEVAQEYYFGK